MAGGPEDSGNIFWGQTSSRFSPFPGFPFCKRCKLEHVWWDGCVAVPTVWGTCIRVNWRQKVYWKNMERCQLSISSWEVSGHFGRMWALILYTLQQHVYTECVSLTDLPAVCICLLLKRPQTPEQVEIVCPATTDKYSTSNSGTVSFLISQ